MSKTLRLTLDIAANDLAGPGCITKLGFAPLGKDYKKMVYSKLFHENIIQGECVLREQIESVLK